MKRPICLLDLNTSVVLAVLAFVLLGTFAISPFMVSAKSEVTTSGISPATMRTPAATMRTPAANLEMPAANLGAPAARRLLDLENSAKKEAGRLPALPGRADVFFAANTSQSAQSSIPLPASAESEAKKFLDDSDKSCRNRDYDIAAKQLQNALDIYLKHLAPTDIRVGEIRLRLGTNLFLDRNFHDARDQLRLAADAYERNERYGSNCLLTYQLLGLSEFEMMNLGEAQRFARKALSLCGDKSISDSKNRQECLRLVLKVAIEQDKPEQVLAICDEQLQLLNFLVPVHGDSCTKEQIDYEAFIRANRYYSLSALGRKAEALAELERAVELTKKTGLEDWARRLQLSGRTDGNISDYLDVCLQDNSMVWSAERMPIKIFLDDSSIAPEIWSAIARKVDKGMQKWVAATDGAIKFEWVRTKQESNLFIRFANIPPSASALAQTFCTPVLDNKRIPDVLHSEIVIDLAQEDPAIPSRLYQMVFPIRGNYYSDPFALTSLPTTDTGCDDPFDPPELSTKVSNSACGAKNKRTRGLSPRAESELDSAILHELGHALGLKHSPNPGDAMFFCIRGVHHVSPRDRNTLRLWYGDRSIELAKAQQKIRESDLAASTKYLSKHPTEVYALLNSAQCERRANRISTCRNHLMEAMRLAPDSAAPHFQMGLADMDERKYKNAIQAFEKSLKLDPKYGTPEVFANLAFSHSRLNNASATATYCEKALSKQPNFHGLRYQYAWALIEQKNYGAALAEVKRFLEIYPSSAMGYLQQGCIYARMHDYLHSVQYYNKALSLNPKDSIIRRERDLAVANLGYWENTSRRGARANDAVSH